MVARNENSQLRTSNKDERIVESENVAENEFLKSLNEESKRILEHKAYCLPCLCTNIQNVRSK